MSDMTKRPVNAGAEARLFAPVNAGACTVELIDYMGGDAQIAEAARCSYGKGTKTVSDDETLIRTLVREAHCYRGDMEVIASQRERKAFAGLLGELFGANAEAGS